MHRHVVSVCGMYTIFGPVLIACECELIKHDTNPYHIPRILLRSPYCRVHQFVSIRCRYPAYALLITIDLELALEKYGPVEELRLCVCACETDAQTTGHASSRNEIFFHTSHIGAQSLSLSLRQQNIQ